MNRWIGTGTLITLAAAVLALAGLSGQAAASPGDAMTPDGPSTTTDGVSPVLRIGTFNLWHGLDPVGTWRFREYETGAEREHRLEMFIRQARAADLDVWLLQEANMLPDRAGRIARELGMDEVHQVDNCGVKLGWGVPVNFRSGLVILAKKSLGLKRLGGIKLSGPAGFCGDRVGFQLSEFRYALVAEVRAGGRRVLLANVHLHHGPELDAELDGQVRALVRDGRLTEAVADELRAKIRGATARRQEELAVLFRFLDGQGRRETPTILGGDLNASPDSEVVADLLAAGFASSTGPWDPAAGPYTWDFERNPHTHLSLDFTLPVTVDDAEATRVLKGAFAKTRRLDYVLLSDPRGAWRFAGSGLFGDEPDVAGVHPSDHLGLRATIVESSGAEDQAK